MIEFKTVYLCGAMENCTVTESMGWRLRVKDALSRYGVLCLDPTRRVHHGDPRKFKMIFERDLIDIRNSDLIIANLNDPKLAKHGTAMEIFYANYILHKPVIAFKADASVKHPFFEQLVTSWVANEKEAISLFFEEFYES